MVCSVEQSLRFVSFPSGTINFHQLPKKTKPQRFGVYCFPSWIHEPSQPVSSQFKLKSSCQACVLSVQFSITSVSSCEVRHIRVGKSKRPVQSVSPNAIYCCNIICHRSRRSRFMRATIQGRDRWYHPSQRSNSDHQ